MFLTKVSLPRRTFLRGLGVTLGLPLLDAMVPAATALANTAATRPRRAGFIYMPHGADMASWTPTVAGPAFELSPTLKILEPVQESLVVVSNLKRAGTVSEMHAAAASGWLSGAITKRTEGEDYRVGTTIDQVLAKQIGQSSRFPSLEFATEDFTGYVGGCAPGYSCAYMNTISWATPTTPLPMEINPRAAFERLFGEGGSDAERQRQAREDRSILDSIVGEARALQSRLSAYDRIRVTGYLDHVREIERRIQRAETQHGTDVRLLDKPLGIPESFEEHTALMFDLLAMALQADLTRVFTFMMSRELSQRTFSGSTSPILARCLAPRRPAGKVRDRPRSTCCARGDVRGSSNGSEHSRRRRIAARPLVGVYGSGMGNSNVHATDPLPMLAAGGSRAGKGHRHLVLPPKTEIGKLWLTVANKFDRPLTKFGESTGTVDFF